MKSRLLLVILSSIFSKSTGCSASRVRFMATLLKVAIAHGDDYKNKKVKIPLNLRYISDNIIQSLRLRPFLLLIEWNYMETYKFQRQL